MKLKMRQLKGLLIGASSLICILAFQNCSPANFAGQTSNPVMFTSMTPDAADNIGRDPGIDPDSSVVSDPESEPESVPGSRPNKDPISDDQEKDKSGLVECELIHPNQKVILSGVFLKGSNNSATRVCMSEHACLRIINEYASKRDCTLSLGASSEAASEAQCTKIFPGSKGTCHNAAVVSEEQVTEILSSMEK
ncbi:hypothetical protein [Bdellovibrio sp. HCB2-146]|uniref:hypothetical protein n=1 Tax=Bdellovibrio sp. HCB2-146 TaxID=3394362 RepID=UPI0039BC2463